MFYKGAIWKKSHSNINGELFLTLLKGKLIMFCVKIRKH